MQSLLSPAAPLTLAAASNESIADSAELMGVGMLIVFIALLLILGLLLVLKRLLPPEKEKGAPSAAAPASTAAPPPEAPAAPSTDDVGQGESDEVDPLTLALLSAAVSIAVRQPSRIRAVRVVTTEGGASWSEKGRTAIHTSHRIRKVQK